MAVPFLLVIFLGGAFADVMKTDPSQCDMESPSFLQLKHQGEQARQDTLQLLMLVSGGHSGPGAVFKCNVTHNPDFSRDCANVTMGRIPAGVKFFGVWQVQVLPKPENGFLVSSFATNNNNDASILHCPDVGDCRVLLQLGNIQGLALDGKGNFCFVESTWDYTPWAVKCCLLSNPFECSVLNTFVSEELFQVYSLIFSPEGHPIIGLRVLGGGPSKLYNVWRCKMPGTCTLAESPGYDQCQETSPPCERLAQKLVGYESVTFGSGSYYPFSHFNSSFVGRVHKCIADEPSPCAQTEVVIGEDAEVTPPPNLRPAPGAVLVENETSLFVADSLGNRVVRCDTSKSPAQCKAIIQIPQEALQSRAITGTIRGLALVATATTTTTTTTTLSFALFRQGVYCYDAGAGDGVSSTSYRGFKEMESRDECEDLCAADVHCNYYSWYPTTARCDRCVFYSTCKYQLQSVCFDENKEAAKIYKKSSENTTRPVPHRSLKVRADLNGAYCQGTEVVSLPAATPDECQGNCSAVSSCQFVAYYFLKDDNAGPVQDATPTACNIQCRLFSGCTRAVKSLCYPPATIWEASSQGL